MVEKEKLMNNMVEIRNLNYSYKNNQVFEDLSLNIEKSSWTTILGCNGAGKTTLARLLVGLLRSHDQITIDGISLTKKTLREIRKNIGVVFDTPEVIFVAETVKDEIAFTLENLQMKKEEIERRVLEIAHTLKLNTMLDIEPHRLSGGQMQKVALASALVLKPKVLILDEALSMIDPYDKEEIMKMLMEYHKENDTTIINFTSDIEEAVYGDNIIGLEKGTIGIEGTTIEVLNEERSMKKLGLELPFIVSLAQKLKLYGLIENIETDIDKLVNEVWK